MKICDPIIHTAMRGAVKIFAAIVLLSFGVRFAYAETTETIYYKEGVRQSATATAVSGSTTRWGDPDREEQWYVVQGRVDIPFISFFASGAKSGGQKFYTDFTWSVG